MGALDFSEADLLQATGGKDAEPMQALEAERAILDLKLFNIAEVGCSAWMRQQEVVERLNAQAHRNAQQHSDEFVVEALVSMDRLSLLITDLLTFEVWKEKVFPYLRTHFAVSLDSVTSYLVLYHEPALTNLLEVTLFHQHACEAVSESALVELCDWCHRSASRLLQPITLPLTPADPKELLTRSPEDDLREREVEMSFATSMASLTILRYLSDHLSTLPLGIIPRLMRTNDTVALLVSLILAKPWQQRRGKQVHQYVGGQWVVAGRDSRGRLLQHEAQAWLAVTNLLTDAGSRAHLSLDSHRMEQLQRLRPLLNDVLLDQVPVLKNLALFLDQLVLSGGQQQQGSDAHNACLIIEQVPSIREALLRRSDWEKLAMQQKETFFGRDTQELSHSRLQAFMRALNLADGSDAIAESTGQQAAPAAVRVHVWRRLKLDLLEPWGDYTCRLDSSHATEAVQVEGEQGTRVHGTRQRLQAMEVAPDAKALPWRSKVAVVHGGVSAEAWVELPAAETRQLIDKLPKIVWVTVGLLATDGFALQLKCRKVEAAAHRDSALGCWCVYVPVGGALNVGAQSPEPAQSEGLKQHPALINVIG
ncbi:hypothetical protein WJX73_006147 [Symbiochloris irregularis]|uniref:Uncharacterized protein n=1 Tax=Symbiochloris irregularis TaxID=706552 RepID=A0AAW1P278_9CHLO